MKIFMFTSYVYDLKGMMMSGMFLDTTKTLYTVQGPSNSAMRQFFLSSFEVLNSKLEMPYCNFHAETASAWQGYLNSEKDNFYNASN